MATPSVTGADARPWRAPLLRLYKTQRVRSHPAVRFQLPGRGVTRRWHLQLWMASVSYWQPTSTVGVIGLRRQAVITQGVERGDRQWSGRDRAEHGSEGARAGLEAG